MPRSKSKKENSQDATPASPSKTAIDVATIAGVRRVTAFPDAFNPMLASLPDGPVPSGEGWVFEPKMDGIRCIAVIKDGQAKLLSRRGLNLTSQYPALARELPSLMTGNGIIDGEIIALDKDSKPSFQQLQKRMNLTGADDVRRAEISVPVHYFVFDITRAEDFDLTGASLTARRSILERLLTESQHVHLIPRVNCDSSTAYSICVDNGFEGIVAKRSGSQYEIGRRSPSWLKVKAQRTSEFVIGGFSPGEGSRASTFGSLLLGYFDESKRLIYCGSVGTGFDGKLLNETMRRLKPLIIPKNPFLSVAADKRNSTWVSPELVAEIKYMDLTDDGHLRTPVFLRFRDDKTAAEIAHPDSELAMTKNAAAKTAGTAREQPPRKTVEVKSQNLPRVAEPSATVYSPSQDSIYEKILGQLSGTEQALELIVGSESIPLSSLNKELWPAYGELPAVTKRDYLRFITRLAPHLLRHCHGRPLTLIRSPLGVNGKFFFQKNWHSELPDYVETFQFEEDGARKEYLLCNNLHSLLFFAQHYVLEFHTVGSRLTPEPDPIAGCEPSEYLNYPDYIIFDLDYHPESKMKILAIDNDAYKRACEIALTLKEILDSAKLESYVKLSGQNGLHIFLPIKRDLDFGGARSIAETISRFVAQGKPDEVSLDVNIKKRGGKVYMDCSSNGASKTIATAYTPRGVPWASVSAPVSWSELTRISPLDLTLYTMPDRLEAQGDIWSELLNTKNNLDALLSK